MEEVLPIDRERSCGDAMLPWVWKEHTARYAFAAGRASGNVVVDCACGEGFGSEQFAAAGARLVIALDVSRDTVRKAALERGSGAVLWGVANATELPLRDNTADLFVSLETLEHLQDEEKFLAEVCRVLAPHGVFVCSTPNRTITNPGARLEDQPTNPFHVREYTREEFEALLAARFGAVEMYGQNPASHRWPALVTRLLPHPLASRVNQIRKLPRLLYDPGDHAVEPASRSRAWEYLTAVCKQPRGLLPVGVENQS